MEPKYVQGDKIRYRDEDWKVMLLDDGRYNLDCLSDPSRGQLSIKTWKVDSKSEALHLVQRVKKAPPKEKKVAPKAKDSAVSTDKDSKWWKFW